MLRALAVMCVVVACAENAPAQATLYGVDASNLVTLDPATGATLTSIPMVPSPATVGGLAYDATTSTMYVASTSLDNLWTVNVTTGATVQVGLFNVGATVVMHGLACDDTGTLYGYSTNAASGARFFKIDKVTAQASPISDPGFAGFGSLGFVAATQTMYVIDTVADLLYTIDRGSGAVTLVGPLNASSTQVGVGLAYDPGFGMYAVNNSSTDTLWKLDLNTGAATLIGNMTTGNDLAIEFVPASAPPCYPDCNNDGALNLSDFGCFQTAFALGQPYADCNGDGVLNLSDFGCFQTKFALGCP